jgi:hypothetical protein
MKNGGSENERNGRRNRERKKERGPNKMNK